MEGWALSDLFSQPLQWLCIPLLTITLTLSHWSWSFTQASAYRSPLRCHTLTRPSIWEGKTCIHLFKKMLFPIAGTSTKAVRHPVDHCSVPLPIRDGALIRASDMQCEDDYAWSVWIFRRYDVLVFLQQFLWIVSINPIGVWGEYATLWWCGSWRWPTTWMVPGSPYLL